MTCVRFSSSITWVKDGSVHQVAVMLISVVLFFARQRQHVFIDTVYLISFFRDDGFFNRKSLSIFDELDEPFTVGVATPQEQIVFEERLGYGTVQLLAVELTHFDRRHLAKLALVTVFSILRSLYCLASISAWLNCRRTEQLWKLVFLHIFARRILKSAFRN